MRRGSICRWLAIREASRFQHAIEGLSDRLTCRSVAAPDGERPQVWHFHPVWFFYSGQTLTPGPGSVISQFDTG
jgi:hypothetical protein